MRQDRPDQITLPVAFIEALSHADSIETVLSVGTEWLTRLIPSTRASLALVDGDRVIDKAARTDGRPDPDYDTGRIVPNTPRARVMETGRPEFLNADTVREMGHVPVQRIFASGLGSMLLAPMLVGETAIGTLSVGAAEPDAFDQAHAARLIALGRWIAAQARLMQQLRRTAQLAETDPLTGLANRTRLMRVLAGPQALHRRDADGRVIGVIHIDLDHFKEMNDSFGHAVGDAILRTAANRMRAAVGNKDLVARIGGDEFLAVTRTDPAGRHIRALARRIADAVARPVQVDEIEARVGASIGIAVASAGDHSAERLIANADIALYEVKRSGRGGVQVFSSRMRTECERRVQLLGDLHRAVAEERFEPHFQPQIALATGRFSGFEVLARWQHPALGVIAPEEFLDLAAEAGLCARIDAIVRAKGLDALRRLRRDGWHAPKMAFNASARTLGMPDLVARLTAETAQHGLAPSDLVIEVKEPDLVALGPVPMVERVSALAAAGFAVQLDNFGSGHTTMTHLSRLAIAAIKLDGALVADQSDPRAETVIRALIALARELRLTVVGGAVENGAQLAALRRLGCDIAQGFGVSKPLPLDRLIAFMQRYGKPERDAPAA